MQPWKDRARKYNRTGHLARDNTTNNENNKKESRGALMSSKRSRACVSRPGIGEKKLRRTTSNAYKVKTGVKRTSLAIGKTTTKNRDCESGLKPN